MPSLKLSRQGPRRAIVALIIAVLVLGQVIAPTVQAITVQQEEELSREFLNLVFRRYRIIREPLVTGYLERIGRRLLEALPPQPFEYHFYMVNDPSYNAFATPAGHIFIHSGLVADLQSEDELAGIIGHEIAHVACRHISQKIERSKKIGAATLAGVVAGVLLGSAGAGEAASALTVGSMAAGQGLALSYSREDEMQADQLGLQNLAKSGFSGRGLLTGLKTIRSREWFGTQEVPTYLKTHPAVEERMAYIDNWTQQEAGEARSPRPSPEFELFHTWVDAMYQDPGFAVQRYARAVEQSPDDPLAHYGYALALDRSGDAGKALRHLARALSRRPLDGYLIKDLGRLHFENGRYLDALNVLEPLAAGGGAPPEAMFYLGRTLLETGRGQEALRILDTLVARQPEYPAARYFLAEALGRAGRLPEAHYHLGLYHWTERDAKNTRFHLERALEGVDTETRREQIRQILEQLDKSKPEK